MVVPLRCDGRCDVRTELPADAQIVRLPRRVVGQHGDLVVRAGLDDGHGRVGRLGDAHQLHAVLHDQLLGDGRRRVRVRLGVAVEDLDRVRRATDRNARRERLAQRVEHERVGLAERRQRARLRRHVADLDRATSGSGGGRRHTAGGRRGRRRLPTGRAFVGTARVIVIVVAAGVEERRPADDGSTADDEPPARDVAGCVWCVRHESPCRMCCPESQAWTGVAVTLQPPSATFQSNGGARAESNTWCSLASTARCRSAIASSRRPPPGRSCRGGSCSAPRSASRPVCSGRPCRSRSQRGRPSTQSRCCWRCLADRSCRRSMRSRSASRGAN